MQDTARGLCGTREVPEHAEHSTKAAQHDQGGAKRRELLDPSVRARPRGGRRTPQAEHSAKAAQRGRGSVMCLFLKPNLNNKQEEFTRSEWRGGDTKTRATVT